MATSKEAFGKRVVDELKEEIKKLDLQIKRLERAVRLVDTHVFRPGGRPAMKRAGRRTRRK